MADESKMDMEARPKANLVDRHPAEKTGGCGRNGAVTALRRD